MSARIAVMVVLIAVGGLQSCTKDVGVRIEDFKPARLPAGVGTQITLQKNVLKENKLDGELLAVTESGLLILLNKPLAIAAGRYRFLEVPFAVMRSARFEQVGAAGIRSEGRAVDEARLERLRHLCRFPQGVSDELKADLLATYGESEVYLLVAAGQPD